MKDAPILILDEATASLDAESEAQIQHELDRLVEGRTALIVAHRFSSIRVATRILVFEDGRIVGDGTHEQLYASCPPVPGTVRPPVPVKGLRRKGRFCGKKGPGFPPGGWPEEIWLFFLKAWRKELLSNRMHDVVFRQHEYIGRISDERRERG